MRTWSLTAIPNTSAGKLLALRARVIAGSLILVLTLARLFVRLRTAHPPAAPIGLAWADRLAPAMHWVLYGLVLVMAGSGVAMAVIAGLPAVVFGGSGVLPASVEALPPRAVHGIVAKLLMLMISLHVAAALYHQLVRRDGLLSRMAFGSRQ